MNLPDKTAISRQPALSSQIYDHLNKLIQDGVYSPGEMLPSETELAKAMEVSRPIVREALIRMKHDGLLLSRKGGRSIVALDTSGLAFRFETGKDEDKFFLAHLYELRAIIGPEAAGLAAQRSSPKDMQNIREKLRTLNHAIDQGGEGTEESFEFHKAILDASGNPQLAELAYWIGKKTWSFTLSYDIEKNGKMHNDVQKEHEALVEAIESRDPKIARRVSRYHIVQAAKRRGISISIPD